jgi:hypothetical protein
MHEARDRESAATGLLRCADAHEAGDFSEIEREFDVFEASLTQDASAIPNDVLLAFGFWDAWTDSSNHDWRYHEPIQRDDWPRLAREIADTLRSGVPIANPVLLDAFGVQPVRGSWLSRLVARLKHKAG